MSKRLTLHLQQNTTLSRVAIIVENLAIQSTDIDQLAFLCQLGSAVLQKNVFPFLRNLSLIDKKTGLTTLGKIAAKIQQSNPDFLGDFLHLVIYQLHFFDAEKRFSYAYATVVQQLWLRKEVTLSPAEKKSIVGEVVEKAAVKFQIPTSEIAFSDSSIIGILNWLRSLSPGVIISGSEGKLEYFSRRYFCSAPIFIKAVDIIYQQRQLSYGTKIFLREDIKDAICQMLLLDPSGLDGTLDNAKCTYNYDQGSFFNWGYEGGYGQWIMLSQSPEWTQII